MGVPTGLVAPYNTWGGLSVVWVGASAMGFPIPMGDSSGFPVVRIAVLMHDCHDDNSSRLIPEQDAKGESFCEAPTDIKINGRVQVWIQNDAIDGILYRYQKPSSKIRLLFLVIGRRREHFGFGVGMELYGLHASAAYALAKTSSAS